MIKEIYRLRVIFFLALIVVVLSVVKVKYGWKNNNTETYTPTVENVIPTVTIEPTKTATEPAVLQVNEEKYPLWDRLPYPGNGFVVRRYSAPKVLYVTLDGTSTPSATKEINVWLSGFGELGEGHKLEFETLESE